MKKCAILFAILLLALVIAVWTERRHQPTPVEQLALEQGSQEGVIGAKLSPYE